MTQLAAIETAIASLAPVDKGRYTALIPVEDHCDFLAQPLAARQEITLHLQAFRALAAAPAGALQQTCRQIAKAIKSTYPDARGYSPQALYKKYLLWRDGGQKPDTHGVPSGIYYAPQDWRCLVRHYNNGSSKGLPAEFIEHLVSEWAKTTRDKDAFRGLRGRLKQDWLKGKEIPGYGTADEWYPAKGLARPRDKFLRDADCPPGWSYSNLLRALKRALPRQSMREAAQGRANRMGTAWGALLKRDRSQLLPLELWTIDDVRLDLQCRMYLEGHGWQIVYIDALFALDVATGSVIGWGLKPRLTRGEDTELGRAAGTKMSINAQDVRRLLLSVMRNGLPPYLSTLLCEMATAKLDKADEAAFLTMLDGRFALEATGMGRSELLKSGFGEQWGRPAVKQWIEAFFRALHTWTNHLPGTVGRRYDLTRGDHKERVKYTRAMLDRATKLVDGELTPDHPLLQQLRLPLLSLDEVNGVVAEIVDALNWRIDHKLQGFNRVFEFQLPDGRWLPQSALDMLDPEDRLGITLKPRREAPAERASRLLAPFADQWQPLAPEVLTALHADKRLVTAQGGRISFKDERLSVDSLDFAVPDDMHTLDAYEGRKDALLAYLADDLSHVVLADAASGAHIAMLEREGRVNMRDREALDKRKGEVNREMQAELSHVRTYLGAHEREFADMRANNDAALAAAAAERTTVSEVARAVTHQRDAFSRKPKASEIKRTANRNARLAEIARKAATN